MAGLVGYDSSEDEEEAPQVLSTEPTNKTNKEAGPQTAPVSDDQQPSNLEDASHPTEVDSITKTPSKSQTVGPIGPSLPPADQTGDLLPEEPLEDEADPAQQQAPLSPYSSNRARIQELTLPTVPDFDIPPSPPGSPPAAVDGKLGQFLDLKRKGLHFNAKLEQSAAMRNPGLMEKLMGFVGMEGAEGYATTLPSEVWDPKGFPAWAGREKLRAAREGIVKEREAKVARGERTTMDFVASKGR